MIDADKLTRNIEEWINEGQLREYLDDTFEKWAFWSGGSSNELFVDDEELGDEEDAFDTRAAAYDYLLTKNGHNLTGEEVSWVMDCGDALLVYKLSEMVAIEDINEPDDGTMYMTFSKNFVSGNEK